MRTPNRRQSCAEAVGRLRPLVFAAVMLAALVTAASGEGTKPFRAARLTYISGSVSVEQASSKSQEAATLNMPLVEGSVVSSGEDGQAEIEFEDGSLVRLTPNSGVGLLNLSVDSSGMYQTRIALLAGLAYLELRAGTKYQFTVDAGGDVISPLENATVRVNFDEPPAVVAVLNGSVHIASASGSNVDANAGQSVRSDAAADGSLYLIKQAIAPESWDQWNEDRDEAAASEAGTQTDARSKFAGDQGYGWSDLDANGSWYDVPGQGEVWQPDGAAAQAGADLSADGQTDFDPYGYGSWVWTPAGYSWASGYGWGWLPYRCGQWSYWNGFGWGWSPGVSCGVFGFGGFGYGSGVNIIVAPGNYKRPHKPIPGPGPIHPIIRGHGPVPIAPVRPLTGTRVIAGKTVEPLQPVGGGYTPRGGTALGSGLQRDFPVDTATHTPVTGLEATHSAATAASNARAAWLPAGSNRGSYATGRQPVYAQRPGYAAPNEGVNRSVPVVRQAPAPRESAPAPRSAPPPASHSSPPAPASHGK